ncbi:MAG: hypothetical protein PHH98_05555 [Candidatus Gracilibacteria bacterium]|nr:hypothetical protein [Candidatus Gracilibacteria bacterium]
MKKILITIFIISMFLFQSENIYAASGTVLVRVTEKIPGVQCNEVKATSGTSSGQTIPNLYDCEVKKGVTQIVEMLGNIIKYFTYIAALAGVLFIVYNGILYSMGGAEPSLKDDAKKRIIGTLIGLILLLLSGPILQLIAPWIYK